MIDSKGYLELIHKPYSQLLAKEIIIAYEGNVTHHVMKAITSVVEEKLEDEEEDESVQRKVYHIMVECLQNINRHAEAIYANKDDYPGRGAILVTKKDKHYAVKTVNLIRIKRAQKLDAFLNMINPLPVDELNDLYKGQLSKGHLSSKGGAGLGFIDIRRKTEAKFEYEFIDNDEETAFFIFKVIIPR